MRVLDDNLPSNCGIDNVEHFGISKNVLNVKECNKILKIVKNLQSHEAGVVINQNEKIDTDIRESRITTLEFNESDYYWIFEKIVPHFTALNNSYFNFDVFGFQEPFQFVEYKADHGHYDDHMDKLLKGYVRKLTVVLQLSDPKDYEGGDLQLLLGGEPFSVPKVQGSIVVFPSYVLHRVTPVTKGTRYTIVGWATGAPFK
ncbi:hypothetical protein EB001_15915 [bacterium]|nr:hypothetical protein [bacterium]